MNIWIMIRPKFNIDVFVSAAKLSLSNFRKYFSRSFFNLGVSDNFFDEYMEILNREKYCI